VTSSECNYCGNNILLSQARCPHCAQPGLFPNVRAAQLHEEKTALENRYNAAMEQSKLNGSNTALRNFENTVLSDSKAVINRSLAEITRLANSNKELYATFYLLIESGIRLPSGDKWDILRAIADDALFSGYKKDIRFAALSIDGLGLFNYGECALVLKNKMIAHRASVLEENSVIFMETHKILMSQAHKLPKGYRATWDERGKLCATKAASDISANTQSKHFAGILLRQGKTTAEDKFVEAHIWGPISSRTFDLVIVNRPKSRADRVILKALQEKLEKIGVKVEVV
jgi:hypothetical protein